MCSLSSYKAWNNVHTMFVGHVTILLCKMAFLNFSIVFLLVCLSILLLAWLINDYKVP